DLAAAVAAALDAPLEYPPLRQALVPGDRVAIGLEAGLPRADCVLAGIVNTLLEGAIEPADICVVFAAGDRGAGAAGLLAELPGPLRSEIDVQVHDPEDQASLAYLAASREGKPIYLNRTLCDADVVIPVGLVRLHETLSYVGVHGGLFPTFSDAATQQRFRAPSSTNWQSLRKRRRDEADEAAWLLGAHFTVQLVPGPGDRVLQVLAGDAAAVERQGAELCASAWRYESPARAKLVVATLEGGSAEQTWDNVARALFSASRIVDDDGAIVLCTDLDLPPGPALRQLASLEDDQVVLHGLMRDRSLDALLATLLLQTRQRAQVFLLSRLEGDVVENLGLGYVECEDDVERLCQRYESCILLANAHRASVELARTASDHE
ncbi:MAG: DUF2088 domain-containing protein, partial [Pirellulaceae bacterium]|nr:DUF2088 domain-containing protein [Pirellulaceae bacterium]